MSTDFQKIREIASASLMPDFFAVRIDEEGLHEQLRVLIAKIKAPTPIPGLTTIQQIAGECADSTSFIEGIKGKNLWSTLRQILTRLQVK